MKVMSDPFHVHISELLECPVRDEQVLDSIPSVNRQEVIVVYPSNSNPIVVTEHDVMELKVEKERETFVVVTLCSIAGVVCVWERLVSVQRMRERDA